MAIDYDELKEAANGGTFAYSTLRKVLEELADVHLCPDSTLWGYDESNKPMLTHLCEECIVCLAKRWAEENKR